MQNRRTMWHIKLVKRGIIGLVVLLGLAIAGLEILSRVYQEKAGAFFREKFSQQSDLVLQPFQTTVSVWTHFPRITFRLKELSLVDTSGGQPVQVLRVGRTEIAVPLGQFNLNRLQINQLILTDVLFRQRIDSAGNKIGLRFKKIENPDTSATQLPFVIPKLLIRNARFISENQYKQSGFSVQVGEASLRASLKDQVLQIDGKVSGRVDSITSKQVVLFRNELFTGAVQYAYNLSQKTGRISNTSLVLNQHPIRVAGTHTTLPQGAGNGLDLKISGDQPILYVLTQLLPPQAKTFLSHIKSKSNLQFSLHITGASGPVTRPRNLIKFALRNGEVYLPATKTSIGQVTLVGEMDNGILQKPESSRLTISEFSANTREDSFRVALEVSNFLKPAFHFTGQGRMRLEKLAAFVKLPVTRITGGAVVGKVNLSGILPDSLHPKTPDWRGQGSVVLQKASFRPLGLTIDCQEVNGGIRFTDDLLDLQGLHGTIGGHPFSVQASVKNFLAYLFDQPGAVTAKASIYAATLNTDWLDQQALGRKNKDMAGASKNGAVNNGSAGVQSALEGLASQVNLRVDKLQLPAGEKVFNLVMQVDQLE
ncbi:MAG TPA: hypothetical protein VK927_07225, partial [Adhaeribacter sp.]|nr:hypothetical protein [Adhaeribacter sp.]